MIDPENLICLHEKILESDSFLRLWLQTLTNYLSIYYEDLVH